MGSFYNLRAFTKVKMQLIERIICNDLFIYNYISEFDFNAFMNNGITFSSNLYYLNYNN